MSKKILLSILSISLLFVACHVPKAGQLLTKEQSVKIFNKYCKKNKLSAVNYSAEPQVVEKYHVFNLTNNASPFLSGSQGIWIDRRNASVGPYEKVNPILRESTNTAPPESVLGR